jgi:ABC-type phosphate transport system substrate-binding protein
MRAGLLKVVFLAMAVGGASAEVLLVMNPDAEISSVEPKTVEDVFLGRKNSLPNGSKVVPVVLSDGAVHEEFLKAYVNRSVSQFNSHWKKLVFTGQGRPPKKLSSEAEVISFVSTTPNAIGYVGAGADVKAVKVIGKQ